MASIFLFIHRSLDLRIRLLVIPLIYLLAFYVFPENSFTMYVVSTFIFIIPGVNQKLVYLLPLSRKDLANFIFIWSNLLIIINTLLFILVSSLLNNLGYTRLLFLIPISFLIVNLFWLFNKGLFKKDIGVKPILILITGMLILIFSYAFITENKTELPSIFYFAVYPIVVVVMFFSRRQLVKNSVNMDL